MKRAELLAHNKAFMIMAAELLHALRGTEDKSCSVCGAEVGVQHRAGFVCRSLVEWRWSARYGLPKDPSSACDAGAASDAG